MNILITGGASGLGEAITKCLVKQPNNFVYFTYCRSNAKAAEIETEFINSKAICCDFKDGSSVQSLVEQIAEFDLDVLLNNATTGIIKDHFQKIKPSEFSKSFQENIIPVIQITQEAIKQFRKKKFGKIITILSAAVINKPPVGWSEYTANKNYLLSLCRSWATENASLNITANCISPSFMQTNLTSDTDERIVEIMTNNHPLKNLLTTQEVADVVNYFVNSSQQINGVNFIINAAADLV